MGFELGVSWPRADHASHTTITKRGLQNDQSIESLEVHLMCSLFENKNFIRSVFLPPLPSPPFAETENTTNGTNLDEGASSLCVYVCVYVCVHACAGKCVCACEPKPTSLHCLRKPFVVVKLEKGKKVVRCNSSIDQRLLS